MDDDFNKEDPLAPAKGTLLGIGLGICLWAAILAIAGGIGSTLGYL